MNFSLEEKHHKLLSSHPAAYQNTQEGQRTDDVLVLVRLPVLQRINQLHFLLVCLWNLGQYGGCWPAMLTYAEHPRISGH